MVVCHVHVHLHTVQTAIQSWTETMGRIVDMLHSSHSSYVDIVFHTSCTYSKPLHKYSHIKPLVVYSLTYMWVVLGRAKSNSCTITSPRSMSCRFEPYVWCDHGDMCDAIHTTTSTSITTVHPDPEPWDCFERKRCKPACSKGLRTHMYTASWFAASHEALPWQ